MARKQKELQIGDKTYTIKELTVNQILQLFGGELAKDGTLSIKKISAKEENKSQLFDDVTEIIAMLKKAIGYCCPDITFEALGDMGPSEVMELWDGFKEVNSDFFVVLKSLGVLEMLEATFQEVKEAALSNFSKIAAIS
jgi:hypothetical protein